MAVSPHDVDWQSTLDSLSSPFQGPVATTGVPRSSKSDPAISYRDRGRPDLYKHMDVRIVHGALKGNFGTVISTHWAQKSKDSADEYEEVAVVETETQTVRSRRTYHLGELRERQ